MKLSLREEQVDGQAYWVLRDALGVAAVSRVRDAIDPERRRRTPAQGDVDPSPADQGREQAGADDKRRTS